MSQKKRTMTAFDWSAFALAVIFFIGAAYLTLRESTPDRAGAGLSYTVRIRNINTGQFDPATLIEIGDAVFSENGTLPLGAVREVNVLPHREAVVQDGSAVFTEVPERIDLDVTVSAVGTYSQGLGWRVSEVRIAAGTVCTLRIGDYYAADATVLALRIEEEAADEGS